MEDSLKKKISKCVRAQAYIDSYLSPQHAALAFISALQKSQFPNIEDLFNSAQIEAAAAVTNMIIAHEQREAEAKRAAEEQERERLIQLALHGYEAAEPLSYKRDKHTFTQDWRRVELIVSLPRRRKNWNLTAFDVNLEEQRLTIQLYEGNWKSKRASAKTDEYDETPDVVLSADLWAPIVLACASFWRLLVEENEEMSDDPKWTTANKKAIEQKKKAAALIFSLRKADVTAMWPAVFVDAPQRSFEAFDSELPQFEDSTATKIMGGQQRSKYAIAAICNICYLKMGTDRQHVKQAHAPKFPCSYIDVDGIECKKTFIDRSTNVMHRDAHHQIIKSCPCGFETVYRCKYSAHVFRCNKAQKGIEFSAPFEVFKSGDNAAIARGYELSEEVEQKLPNASAHH